MKRCRKHFAEIHTELTVCQCLQGEEFDSAVRLTAEALCELKSAPAISGLMALCEQVTNQKYSWMSGTVMKAKGW